MGTSIPAKQEDTAIVHSLPVPQTATRARPIHSTTCQAAQHVGRVEAVPRQRLGRPSARALEITELSRFRMVLARVMPDMCFTTTLTKNKLMETVTSLAKRRYDTMIIIESKTQSRTDRWKQANEIRRYVSVSLTADNECNFLVV